MELLTMQSRLGYSIENPAPQYEGATVSSAEPMDWNLMITEIRTIKIGDNDSLEHKLPCSIWLESLNNNNIETSVSLKFDNSEKITLDVSSKSILTICTTEELKAFMLEYKIPSYDILRIELRETKKWGIKPLFDNGINSICFQILVKDQNNHKIIVLYNTSGSHEIESIYVHGIWLI